MNRPPPFNPYMFNNNINQNVATAPPFDGIEQNESYINDSQYLKSIHSSPNNINNQNLYNIYPSYPQPIYIPPETNYNYITSNEEYRNGKIERNKRKEEEEICCIGIFGLICCCCL